jgi:hypothetical protein
MALARFLPCRAPTPIALCRRLLLLSTRASYPRRRWSRPRPVGASRGEWSKSRWVDAEEEAGWLGSSVFS